MQYVEIILIVKNIDFQPLQKYTKQLTVIKLILKVILIYELSQTKTKCYSLKNVNHWIRV